MIRRPPRSTQSRSSAASDVYKRQWLITAVVAFVAVPITVRGLGASVYGVVALAGAMAGYFGVLDVGLPEGVIRYVSMFASLRHGRAMRQLLAVVLTWFAGAGAVGTAVI